VLALSVEYCGAFTLPDVMASAVVVEVEVEVEDEVGLIGVKVEVEPVADEVASWIVALV
jgi:hypothetical protein